MSHEDLVMIKNGLIRVPDRELLLVGKKNTQLQQNDLSLLATLGRCADLVSSK